MSEVSEDMKLAVIRPARFDCRWAYSENDVILVMLSCSDEVLMSRRP